MDIEVKIDEKYTEPKVIIYTNKIDEKISNIMNVISNKNTMNGYKDEKLYILEQADIESIYSQDGKVYARCNNDIYILKNRLYELEGILNKEIFIRISKSEIINFKKVENIDFKITGTIIFNFIDGNKSYVSRRYIKNIKEYLEI